MIRVFNQTKYTTFRNIGIIAGSAIVIFMVVAVAAIGAAWEAKSLKILNNLTCNLCYLN
jgi:hypothetical protein